MTKSETVHRCVWCGARFAQSPGPGRARRYCRRSHRQRHYEARKLAVDQGLSDDEVVFRQADISQLRDHLYVLEAAIQDARMDLADSGRLEDYPEAFRAVAGAADRLLEFRLEPQALG